MTTLSAIWLLKCFITFHWHPPENPPKKSSQKNLQKKTLPKNPPKKFLSKNPSKNNKESKKNPKNSPKKSLINPKNFQTISEKVPNFENIQFPTSHLEAKNPFGLVFHLVHLALGNVNKDYAFFCIFATSLPKVTKI